MKKHIFLVAILCCAAIISSFSQVPNLNTAKTKASPGKLLTQFANALKPASMLNSFAGEKSGWLAKAGKIANAVEMASSISSLAGFIKPDMFKSGFNVNSLLQTANTVKTMTDAAGLLKNLEGGLKPEAFLSGWTKQKAGWTSALNLLK